MVAGPCVAVDIVLFDTVADAAADAGVAATGDLEASSYYEAWTADHMVLLVAHVHVRDADAAESDDEKQVMCQRCQH
jgi:hypothetical protein